MRYLLYIFAFLLLCSGAWGFGPGPGDCTGDSVEVTSATYTFSSDTCYYITQNLSSDNSGWTITPGDSNLRINMQDYSLTYAAAGDDDDEVGLTIGANCFDITIENGDFIHGGDSTTDTATTMYFGSGCRDIWVRQCSLYVQGGNAAAVNYGGGDPYDLRFDTCQFISEGWGFTDANQSDGHTIKFISIDESQNGTDPIEWLSPPDTGYDIYFYGCYVYGPAGLSCGGKTIVNNCEFLIDARNDFYDTLTASSHGDGMKNSCAIGGALGDDAIICSTTIRADTVFHGLDEGLLLQTCRATSGHEILIFGNDVHTHFGRDHWYDYSLMTKAIKLRYGNNGVKIYDNIFKTTIGDTTLSSYGRESASVYLISNRYSATWLDSSHVAQHLDSNIWIYGNDIISDTNGTAIHRNRAVMISAGDDAPEIDHDWDSVGIHWYGNKTTSNGWCYNIGDSDGDARGVRIREDTVTLNAQIGSEYHNTVCVATDWAEGDSCINNRIEDCYYLSGSETDIAIFPNTSDGTWSELELWRTVECTVTAGGSAVSGVTVSFLSDANNDTLTSETNGSGVAEQLVRYYDNFAGPGSPDDTLIADYYPFTMFVTVNDSLLTDTLNVVWDNYQITLAHPTAEGADATRKIGKVKLGKVKL